MNKLAVFSFIFPALCFAGNITVTPSAAVASYDSTSYFGGMGNISYDFAHSDRGYHNVAFSAGGLSGDGKETTLEEGYYDYEYVWTPTLGWRQVRFWVPEVTAQFTTEAIPIMLEYNYNLYLFNKSVSVYAGPNIGAIYLSQEMTLSSGMKETSEAQFAPTFGAQVGARLHFNKNVCATIGYRIQSLSGVELEYKSGGKIKSESSIAHMGTIGLGFTF